MDHWTCVLEMQSLNPKGRTCVLYIRTLNNQTSYISKYTANDKYDVFTLLYQTTFLLHAHQFFLPATSTYR